MSGVDVPAVAERLGTPLHTVRRDGMTAHVTGVEAALTESFLPFFVGSDSPRHPGEPAPPAASRGSRSRATRRACASGSAAPSCRCGSSTARPRVRAIGIGERSFSG